MKNFTTILKNDTDNDIDVELLDATSQAGQETNPYRVVTSYQSINYPAGTYFKLIYGNNSKEITLTEEKSVSEMVTLFNTLGIGYFSLYANNASDGTVYQVRSIYNFVSMEVILGIESPVFASAETNIAGTQIEITFDRSMSDPTGHEDEFSYSIDGSPASFDDINLKSGDDTIFVLNCNTRIEQGQAILINYTKGSVTSDEGGLLDSFSNNNVSNNSEYKVYNFGNGLPDDIGLYHCSISDTVGDYGQPVTVLTSTGTDPQIFIEFLPFPGNGVSAISVQVLRMRVKRTSSGSWQGRYFYSGSGQGRYRTGPLFSAPTLDEWEIIEIDMSGVAQFTGMSEMDRIRLDFFNYSGDTIEIDWIALDTA